MVEVHGRAATGRQQHGLGGDETECAGPDVQHQHARQPLAVAGPDQRQGPMLLHPLDAARPHLLGQSIDDLDAGQVALVHGAVDGLAGEGLEVQAAIGIAVEEAAPAVLQLDDAFDRAFDQPPGEILVVQPLAAFDRVHEVAFERVTRSQRHVVSALDHAGAAALAEQAFHRDGDLEVRVLVMRMQRCQQPGAAGAQNQQVGLVMLDPGHAKDLRTKPAPTASAAAAAQPIQSF